MTDINKKTTCGVIIINEFNELLMGKSNGNNFFDIPKGLKDEGETYLQAAIRECKEETNLSFNSEELIDLGLFPYNKEKNIYLFFIKLNKEKINMNNLKCNSYYEHYYSKKMLPEIDYFNWINCNELNQKASKSMFKILSHVFSNHPLFLEVVNESKKLSSKI